MPAGPMLVDAIKEPGIRLLRASVVFIFHGLTVSLLIGVMWAIEAWLLILWKHEPLIYDKLPLRYLIQTIDVGLLVVLGTYGIYETWQAYRRPVS